MKTSTILLSIALAFRTIYSKAIDDIVSEQLNVESDVSVEIVKSDNFIYKLHCPMDKEFCGKIKNEMEYAFTKISNAFEFYQPVVFEAYVEDKIFGSSGFAAVTDSNYIPLKSSNDSVPYIYPQALTKQLKLNKEPDYKENDFVMIINSIDGIEYTFIHELLHGLGIFNKYSVNKLDKDDVYVYGNLTGKMFLHEGSYAIFPELVPYLDEKSMENVNSIEEFNDKYDNLKVSKYLPLSVFDKYIASLESGEKLFDTLSLYFEELNQKCLPKDGSPLLIKDLTNEHSKECFENLSPETQESITRIVNDYYFKQDSTGFLTKDGDIIALQTYNEFRPASSIGHVRNLYNEKFEVAYSEFRNGNLEAVDEFFDLNSGMYKPETYIKYYDDNYILYDAKMDPFTVEEMIELLPNNKKHPLIGDGIVKIMTTMGWTEKGEKRTNELYYVDETIEIPESQTFKCLTKKEYELMPELYEEEEPSFNIEETETALPIDSNDTDIEVDVEVTLSPDQDSDSDSDNEEEKL